MKNIILLTIFLNCSFNMYSQKTLQIKIDSLQTLKYQLTRQISRIDSEIERYKREISISPVAFTSVKVKVQGTMNMKESPDLTANILTWIYKDSEVEVIGYENDDFYKVKYKNEIGYITTWNFENFPQINDQLKNIKLVNSYKNSTKSGVSFTNETNLNSSSTSNSSTSTYNQYNSSKNTTYGSSTSRTTASHSEGCSSSRCTATTQKGARCKRITTNCSGRCWQH